VFPLNLSNLNQVLCLGAHPDDIEIGCGGILLTLLEKNHDLKMDWVIFSADERRKLEAERSFANWSPDPARCRLTVHSFADSFFPWEGQELKQTLHELSRRTSPDLIFTTRQADLHQDHRVLSELTWNAFRDHLILEYEIPKYDGDLGRPNLFFPLATEIAHEKVSRLMSNFESQHTKFWYRSEIFESLMRIRGMECNAASGFAEGFYASKITVSV
jgi:LmbE family N-acetylglucosaminyl deacetylase